MQSSTLDGYTENKNIKIDTYERYNFIDLLKVIAISFVLLYHATTYSVDFLSNGESVEYFRYFMHTILSTCVPLFFLANGFLLMNKEFNLKKHIVKSIRMVIITFIWGAIDLFLLSIIDNISFSKAEFINALVSWKYGMINHMWYMGALICIYVFFPLIKITYDKSKKIYFYFVIIAAVFTFGSKLLNIIFNIIVNINTSLEWMAFFNPSNWLAIFNPFREIYGYTFVYFCVGGCLPLIVKRINENRTKSNIIAIIAIIVSMLLLFVTGIILSHNKNSVWDVVWYGYDTIFTFVNTIAIFVLTTNYNGRKKNIHNIIVKISKNTLGIYFIHVVFISLIQRYIENISFLSNMGGTILVSFVVLLLSLFTTLLIKKIPFIKKIL